MPNIQPDKISLDVFIAKMQLAGIYKATEALFLGSVYFDSMMGIMVDDDKLAFQPSFLKIADTYAWGDILKGIEETSHNVSAALLTLDLGTMSADCFFDQQVVVYEYSSFVLWVPYGVSDFYLLSCYNFTLSPLCFIDSLGYFFDFTRCCLHDNGKK